MTKSTAAAIAEAKAAISRFRRDMKRHERMLADAKRDGEHTYTLHEIEVFIANDKVFIAAMERRIEDEMQKATDPVLIALRERVGTLSFLDCVALISSNEETKHLWIPPNTPDRVAHLRETVFEKVRAGILSL